MSKKIAGWMAGGRHLAIDGRLYSFLGYEGDDIVLAPTTPDGGDDGPLYLPERTIERFVRLGAIFLV